MSDYFPRDVWDNILQRLPIKSIVTCMSVCKFWKSLITDHDLASYHLKRTLQANDSAGGSLLIKLCTPMKESYNIEWGEDFHLDNGLICLADLLRDRSVEVLIGNPSIRRYVILPTSEICASDYIRPPCLLGFGYDSKNKDFKVVKIMGSGYDNKIIVPRAEVFSLASSSFSWRNIITSGVLIDEETSQMFRNGAIHWVMKRTSNNSDYFILSFDVTKETFRELSLGPCLKETPSAVTILAGSLDSLAISTCYSKSETTFFSIWVMKKYAVMEPWNEIYCFDSRHYGDISGVSALWSETDGGMVLIDSRKNSVTDLENGKNQNSSVGSYAYLFLINKEQGICPY
ncbi:F-box protein At3g07870-like [Neltuma alba]|uniref:F-box protein At3g07870-like n=1 Tax=Neltuma alba TaxID=207710 RepID=UPI0010A2AD33|nr:F-box protein At3g07870-like [Prosopis alba]